MPKINKEFTDALGFRLLSVYQGFVNEYPVEGAKIQKLYDDGFRETCIKCYPVIAEAGVDPFSYEPKSHPTSDLKYELRKMFPVKPKTSEPVEKKPVSFQKSPTPETIDLTEEEDELTVAEPLFKPVVVLPKPAPKPATVTSTPNVNYVQPTLNRPSPLKPGIPSFQKCLNCGKLRQQVSDLEAANNKLIIQNKTHSEVIAKQNVQIKNLASVVGTKNNVIAKLQQTIANLEKENFKMVGLVKQCQATVNDLDLQIEGSKKRKQ